MQPEQGTIVAGRFRLDRPLGQGGMGAVWLAQHLSLDVPCALKFLHPDAANVPDIRARFEREARAAAHLRSPNVVQIYDHGVWEDMPFIAMELLEGEDLDQRLRRVRRLDPRDTVTIIAQVARALGKAHAAGLVHRDLKPGNIFLVRDEDREVAKVLDFGIAKDTLEVGADSKTKTGALMGTPYYMSPEQARGLKEVDHRTDLWALGVIAYQCVVGQLPFPGDALGDLFMKIMVEPLPVPTQLAPVPPGFDAWWARAAARDPGHRFQSAKEMADALAMALGVSVGAVDAYGQSHSGMMRSSPALAGAPPGAPMPGAPYTPMPGQAPTPMPYAQTPMPSSGQVLGAAPLTANPIASEIKPAASGGRGATVIVAVLLAVAVLGGAGFVVFGRGGGSHPASTATPAPTSPPVALPEPTSTSAATPTSTTTAAAPPSTTATTAPSASASSPTPRAPGAPPTPPTHAPKPPPAAGPKPRGPSHDDGI